MAQKNQVKKLFDRELIAKRLQKASIFQTASGPDNFIADLMINDLKDRLSTITRKFEKALLLAPHPDFFAQNIKSAEGPINFDYALTLPSDAKGDVPFYDPARLDLPHNDYDLIVSLADLHMMDDVPGFFVQAQRYLRPDGLCVVAALGGDSLTELRQAWLNADVAHSGGAYARVAPFIDIRDGGALLQRGGFALPVTDLEHYVVRYGHPIALMEELRQFGASNPLLERPQNFVSRGLLAKVVEFYADQFTDEDGRCRATLDLLWLMGWTPHESQQKPLRPGSATKSLKDVLGDKSGEN
ncbi:NADH dehydrogenase (ubiquinone) 1 alpha subcomplex assembly factor [Maritalea myrionectae]|uniref:NADH dehydrogenase (Ubiquinone) 1 alpha subcomplex assembly factor n=1 Tax=Maritalea myrionectae TaxID=454601 RepID=A0A2R4MAS8_9HYPH|nr:methyltransferase domain-containing protein [Maritalea myrionectae]AVX03147.1 NADH dehydrogenase (ubiquinone) 1 alpha subcomplex assembly factor [Maritalea myrionectae]